LNVSIGVFQISELNLIIALTSALFDDVITRLILLSAVVTSGLRHNNVNTRIVGF